MHLLSLPPWSSLFLSTILLFVLALKICNTVPGKYLGKKSINHTCMHKFSSFSFDDTPHHRFHIQVQIELLRYKNINTLMGLQYLTDAHWSLFDSQPSEFAMHAYRWIMNKYFFYTEFSIRLENAPISTVGNYKQSCYSKINSYHM